MASLPGRENQSCGYVFRTILCSGSIPPPSLRGGQNGRGCCVMRPRNPAKGVHRKRKRQHRRIARQTTPTYENEDAAASTTPPVPSRARRRGRVGQVKAAGFPGGLARRSSFMLSPPARAMSCGGNWSPSDIQTIAAPWIEGFAPAPAVRHGVRAWVGRAQRRILNEPVAVWCHRHARRNAPSELVDAEYRARMTYPFMFHPSLTSR